MYYQHFGLHGPPFNFTTPDRLFLSIAHREGLAALEWGFWEEPTGLTLLVGEVGTGKTTLIRSILARQTAGIRVAFVSNPRVSFEHMLQFIAQEIGIHPIGKGKFAILQALKTFLMDPESGDRVVLVFDEAQGLSDETLEELRLLSNSRPESARSLQIVLIGQPELAQRLSAPQLRALDQRIGARAMLHPLRGVEIYDYVEHLLREQDGHLKIFSRGALDWLVRLSGGIPRKINVICHNALLLAYSDGSAIVKSRHVRAAAADYTNLVASSTRRSFHPTEAARLALHWLSGRGVRAIIGCICSIALVGSVLIFRANIDRLKSSPVFAKIMDGRRAHLPRLRQKVGLASKNSFNLPTAASDRPGRLPPKSQTSASPPAYSPANRSLTNTSADSLDAPVESSPAPISIPTEQKASLPGPTSILSDHIRNTIRYDLDRATAAQREGRYNNAIWHLERAVSLDPNNRAVRDLLLSVRKAKAASVESRRALMSSSVRSPDVIRRAVPVATESYSTNTAILKDDIYRGDTSMQKGDYDNALQKYKAALAIDPENADLHQKILNGERAKTTEAKTLPHWLLKIENATKRLKFWDSRP